MTVTTPYRNRSFPLPQEASAQHPESLSLRRLLLPLPVGEGWGEGLPGTQPRVKQGSFLAEGGARLELVEGPLKAVESPS